LTAYDMKPRPLTGFLPDVYSGFFPDFFRNDTPEETAATCHDCAMWTDNTTMDSDAFVFSRESKCCTHFPNIPNYLAGALLASDDPLLEQGRKRMRELITSGYAVRPQGINRTAKWNLLIRHSPDSFGRSGFLVCPLYDSDAGKCTIRPYWNSVCSTWFCKYSCGQEGREFWLALKRYLTHIERELSRYALFSIGWKTSDIMSEYDMHQEISREDMDELPPETPVKSKIWHDWIDREEQFYLETHRLISELTAEEFLTITGISERILRKQLEQTYEKILNPSLPPMMKRNPQCRILHIDDNSILVSGYSFFDPMKMSRRLYETLVFFDGKKTNEQVIRHLTEAGKAVPDDETLLMLYHYRFLVGSAE